MTSRAPVLATIVLLVASAMPGCELARDRQVVIARLPGAEEFPVALQQRLRAALRSARPDPAARTRHRRAATERRYVNRLILESSPYLLQHAHNPVNWYPWGEEAFAQARAAGKPILLSIGYSTCHWCHVMETESFDDEEIAAFLNTHYVAVKVDREERPDVDSTYMEAVLALTGNGGWPMTVFLTPDRRPFFGGTYFPARDGDRGVAVGFLTILRQLRAAFDTQPLGVADQARALVEHIRRSTATAAGDATPDASLLHAAVAQLRESFDTEHGGFGGSPKFPTPGGLDFLLRYHRRTRDPEVLTMVTRTLEQMANGGIYDHVGGGFHRYATDRAWRIPHFEKMLSDNAQLALVYVDAFQVTGRREFAHVAGEILDYLGREMTSPEGALYTASDADSDCEGGSAEVLRGATPSAERSGAGEGCEGAFFVWSPEDIAAVLPPDSAAAFTAYYGVGTTGDIDGKTILHVARPLDAVAADLGTDPEPLRAVLAEARRLVYAARARRPAPATDTKIVTAWNGLAIAAFARAGAVLGRAEYVERARVAAGFVLDHMRPQGRLRRNVASGRPGPAAFLDDYAFLTSGLLELYEATFEVRWLRESLALHATLAGEFWDESGGGYFLTGAGQEVVLVREKPDEDGALPSGNAVAAENLLRLAEFTGDAEHRQRAGNLLRALGPRLAKAPGRALRLLASLEALLDRPKEIVIVHPDDQKAVDPTLLATVRGTYLPNHMLTVVGEGGDLAHQQSTIPLVSGKRALHGRSTAYVCEQGVCSLPTSDVGVLARQLATVHPLPASGG